MGFAFGYMILFSNLGAWLNAIKYKWLQTSPVASGYDLSRATIAMHTVNSVTKALNREILNQFSIFRLITKNEIQNSFSR